MFGTPFGKLKVEKSFQFQNNYGTFSEKSSSKGSNKFWLDWQGKNNSLHHQNIDHITKFQPMNIKLCY